MKSGRSTPSAFVESNASDSQQKSNHHVKPDLSILRKPVYTSITGFMEVMKAYQDGTDEIRNLLSNECDVIYECRVCRNIFRSLLNFISHKRIYCRETFSKQFFHFQQSDGFIDQDVTTIIQAQEEYVHKSNEKDLCSIIERLKQRDHASQMTRLSDFYEQVSRQLTKCEIEQSRVLRLDRAGNNNAMFQSIHGGNNDPATFDTMQSEVREVHDLLSNDRNFLGPDGKLIAPYNINEIFVSDSAKIEDLKDASREKQSSSAKEILKMGNFICRICKSNFITEKTLKVHIKVKHTPSTFVYPCPSCPNTFLQPGAVIRHLCNDHKKSMKRIRQMRDSIYKRRIRLDEVPVKGPSRELAGLHATTEKDKIDAQNKAWLENIENFDHSPICTFCGKTFERKAVLTTHLNNCAMRRGKHANAVKKLAAAKTVENGDTSDVAQVIGQSNLHGKLFAALSGTESVATVSKAVKETEVPPPMIDLDMFTNKRKRKKRTKIMLQDGDDTSGRDFVDNSSWLKSCEKETIIVVNDSMQESTTVSPAPEKSSETDAVDSITDSLPTPVVSRKEKDNECSICVRRFANRSNLRRHVAMFHYRPKRYGCNICKFEAIRKPQVINHLQLEHGIPDEKEVLHANIIFLNEELSKSAKTSPDKSDKSSSSLDKSSRLMEDENTLKKKRKYKLLQNKVKSTLSISEKCGKSAKIMRTSSSSSLPDIGTNTDIVPTMASTAVRRPVRNRVKPVNKDFVYDLSSLLRKDSEFYSTKDLSVNVPTQKHIKRRNTMTSANTPDQGTMTENQQLNSIIEIPSLNTIVTAVSSHIHEASYAMAKQAVDEGRAAFSQIPVYPNAERPTTIPSKSLQVSRQNSSSDSISSLSASTESLKIEQLPINFKKRKRQAKRLHSPDSGYQDIFNSNNIVLKLSHKEERIRIDKGLPILPPVKMADKKLLLAPLLSASSSTISQGKRKTLMQRLAENNKLPLRVDTMPTKPASHEDE